MKTFLSFILVNLFAVGALAASLVIRNTTDVEVRIDSLRNQCDGFYINYQNPVTLKPGGEYVLEKTTAVVHTYKICGAGYCSGSAMGMQEDIEYVLNIELEDGWLINGVPVPDHWVGNIECPQSFY